MERKELLDYLRIVKDLESAKYEQTETVFSISQKYNKWIDTTKRKIDDSMPKMPNKPYERGSFSIGYFDVGHFIIVFIAYIIISGIIEGIINNVAQSMVYGFCVIAALIGIIKCIDYIKLGAEYNNELKIYNEKLAKYNKEYADWKNDLPQLEQDLYGATKSNFPIEYDKLCNQLQKTNNLLDNYYNLNIIHPKYRNLTALCSLYEYIDTGRCDKLEGPDGAYNIYEQELRLDRIIFDLDEIKANVEMIKNNQFTLYNCIKEINSQLRYISNTGIENLIKSNNMNAYYQRITAYNTTAEQNATRFGVLAGLNKYSVISK